MDVTQLSGWNVTDCSEVAGRDVRPLIDRVLTYARDSITAGVPPCPATPAGDDNGVAPAPGKRVTPEQARKELDRLEEQAEGGDGASARRAAELYELLEDMNTAASWWRTAARLGDQDAADYVRGVLGE